jgi:hypothetical protein
MKADGIGDALIKDQSKCIEMIEEQNGHYECPVCSLIVMLDGNPMKCDCEHTAYEVFAPDMILDENTVIQPDYYEE